MTAKVLRNGTLLSFDEASQSIKVLSNASIVIQGDEITALGDNIEIPQGAEVIDVSNKIVSPGFINTHSHLWQSVFRTMGPNLTLAEYFGFASQLGPTIKHFSPQDVYVSCLEGYYEGLNGGVTAFVEHATNNWDIEVVQRGYDAAIDGGARVWWCPDVMDRKGASEAEKFRLLEDLLAREQDERRLVSLGMAYDHFGSSSPEMVDQTKEMVEKLKLEAITLHYIGGDSPWPVPDTSPTAAEKAGLQNLDIPIVFSHGGCLTDDDKNALRKHNWNLSITPESEMHYGHGQETSHFVHDQASLGVDTNFTFAGDILAQARLWLQNVRGISYNNTLKKGLIPKESPMSVEDAFLLATRQGGKAVRRDDLGVLKVGARADLVVFNGDSANMSGWTDAIAAVVLHANAGDIEHVIVGGEFRKRDYKLIMRDGGDWRSFAKEFASTARRIQTQYTDRPTLEGDKLWGMVDFGEVEKMSTRR